MLEITDLKNNSEEKILILGLGLENQQFLEWLINIQRIATDRIIIADQKLSSKKITFLNNFGLKYQTGENYLDVLNDPQIGWVFKSPGIWSLLPELENFRIKKGIDRVNSSLIFFIQKYKSKIIGITGTKGKSTTASLTTHLLNKLNFQVDYCGNTTGISPYQFWAEEKTTKLDPRRFWVLELSSFQLQDLGFGKISPSISTITNYGIDHLDQHYNLTEYYSAKDQIFLYQNEQDFLIYNQQVLENSFSLSNSSSQKLEISSNFSNFLLLNFAIPKSLQGKHNLINLVLSLGSIFALFLKNFESLKNLPALNLKNLEKGSFSILDFKKFISTNKELFSDAISCYPGLPFRQEIIATKKFSIDQIKKQTLPIIFINDGYASQPTAVEACLERFFSDDENNLIWLQVCGKDKGGEYKNLAKIILNAIKKKRLFKLEMFSEVGLKLWKEITNLPDFQKEYLDILSFQSKKKFNSLETLEKTKISSALINFKKSMPLSDFKKKNLYFIFSPGGSSFDEFSNILERSNWWSNQVFNLNFD